MAGDDAIVSYTVREIFERIDERLVRMDAKLDAKADKAELDPGDPGRRAAFVVEVVP